MKDHVVIITYQDGHVDETMPLTEEHARLHCETVKNYPSVRSAVVVKRPIV